MNWKALLLSSFLASILLAKEKEEFLKQISFFSSWHSVRKEPILETEPIYIDGVSFLLDHPEFVSEIQEEYLGAPLEQQTLSSLQEKILHFYESYEQPLVVVSIPEQNLSQGALQVVVQELKLGQVFVRNNQFFPSRWFAEAIRQNPGETIDRKMLLEDLSWLNLSPFRRTDAKLKPTSDPTVADLELITADRWPYRVYIGTDNSGTDASDRERLFFGFNFGKSILPDGQISYQCTFSPNWNTFYAHTASARLPLPWRHIWMLWGGYSQVEPKDPYSQSKNRGISWQVDTRYRIPSFTSTNLLQTFVIGYDFKETNNLLEPHHVEIFKNTVDINQFMVGYELGYRHREAKVSLVLELYASPGSMTHNDKTSFYEAIRRGAKDQYVYVKLAHSAACPVRLGWLTYDLTGQASTSNLLQSEQMTMTGYNAVRGYEERILSLDNALIVNLAYQTPHWNIARFFGAKRNWDELYFLAFFDYAIGANHQVFSNESSWQSLSSVGPGIRYQFDRYLTLRFDYGFQLSYRGFDNPSSSRYNFGLIMSY